MAKTPRSDVNPNIVNLWPTTILAKRFAQFQKVNPAFLELFYQHRDREQRNPQQAYASNDDLLSQYHCTRSLMSLPNSSARELSR